MNQSTSREEDEILFRVIHLHSGDALEVIHQLTPSDFIIMVQSPPKSKVQIFYALSGIPAPEGFQVPNISESCFAPKTQLSS